MEYTHRFRARPNEEVAAALTRHIDIHRQAYNHTRYEYENLPSDTDTIGSAYKHHKRLTEWKDRFPVFSEVHSKALQRTVTRFYDNLGNLSDRKAAGYNVGKLRWKPPREYRSMTYSQSGFELKNTSGQTATLWLTKIGDIPIRYHRDIPDEAVIKEVTVKHEYTGEWFVSFALEVDDADLPEKPPIDELEAGECVGVDLGILNYIHTSDGLSVGKLDVEAEYGHLRKAQRTLSRREQGSENWEEQRRRVASIKRRIRRKVLDFQHKLTTWLVTEYDAVFVEDLDVKPLLEDSQNARNKQDAAWRQFITLLQYKADLHGCHVKQVDPENTTKQCHECGVKTDKPLWVREHSCPSCGFLLERDWNAALNVLERGLRKLGLGQPEVQRLLETGAAVDATHRESVSASAVVEAGSPTERKGSPGLNEAAVTAE
ncbi:RNA-guided endonuclease InsQ/TnpB family protein [Halorussus halophilus]|uniref:RNA-guided endonuclease InsQ/TnpB family protein n=1 Tax=Halorussus halophilus TaxID=2650975 RepID=UPI00130141A0|nr:RNA-guided endonuclease TnpB family protein [Halorussus halophilus]